MSLPCQFVLAAATLVLLLRYRTSAQQVLPLASLVLPFIVMLLRRRRQGAMALEDPKAASARARANSESDGADHVRWSFLPSNGVLRTNMPEAVRGMSDFAEYRFVVLHRPTHDKAVDSSGAWRYGWHFKGRKRIWEVRCQIKWKRPPRKKIFFGLEMACGQEGSSGTVARVKGLILAAIRSAIGKDFYQTAGDPPNANVDELEPNQFVMPLWTVDQFHVGDRFDEVNLTGDLGSVGMRRTDGLKQYKAAMKEVVENISTDKVYTFCFWGISQFIDVNLWQFQGLFPGVRMDALKLSGPPPIFLCFYGLQDCDELSEGDPAQPQRHLISKKDYYCKAALWSELKPPAPELLRKALSLPDEAILDDGKRHVSNDDHDGVGCGIRRVMQRLPLCGACVASDPGAQRSGKGNQKEKTWFVKAGQAVLGGCMGQQ